MNIVGRYIARSVDVSVGDVIEVGPFPTSTVVAAVTGPTTDRYGDSWWRILVLEPIDE